ncbi:MAG: class I SAM-dependent methyltransferase [Candidatus Aenigmatarchaeota archaeon]
MNRCDWDRRAKNYHEEVVSPFQKGVSNPLFKKLKGIKNMRRKTVADIGCGRGEILDYLASDFKKVYGIDFSPKMLRIAERKNSRKNIEFVLGDMKNLEEFRESFDVVISANSVLFPDLRSIRKSLKSINSTIKKGGIFFGIFPSMGSILYQGILIMDEQFKSCSDEKRVLAKTNRILERRKYDFVKGIYDDDGCRQKFYYNFELRLRLKNAGFKNIKISKVLYPWKKGISDHVIFAGKPKMWDWFVSAKK